MRETGWAADVPEEVPATNTSRDRGLWWPLEQPSSSVGIPSVAVAAVSDVPAGTSDVHLDGMLEMLRVMGNVPYSILNSNSKDVMLAFFQGRMSQGRSGGGPGSSCGM